MTLWYVLCTSLLAGYLPLIWFTVRQYRRERIAIAVAELAIRRESDRSIRLHKGLIDLYDTMSEAQHVLKAKRLLLIITENGGNALKRGGRRYITVVYECFDFPFTSCKEMFFRYPLDDAYEQLLDDLVENNTLLIKPKDKPPPDPPQGKGTEDDEGFEVKETSGFLSDYYRKRKVQVSRVHMIHPTPERLVYMSLNYPEDSPTLDDVVHHGSLERYSGKIRAILYDCPDLLIQRSTVSERLHNIRALHRSLQGEEDI